MKSIKLYIILAGIILLLFFQGCSTQKNTRATRNYHELTSRYNVFFNGEQAFLKGKETFEKSVTEDYSDIIPMFLNSYHDNLPATKSNMDRAIEKGKKLIKRHSIRVKPKKDYKKMRNPKYQEWINQEEFNPMVDDAYMLMGRSHFYMGEFLEAVGVFNYVARHFPTLPVRYEAKIWMARSYAELGWYYEAEDIMRNASDDEMPEKLTLDYNSVMADIKLKQKKYDEAIPYLKQTIANENSRSKKRRYYFILAQLYQKNENFDNAVASYKKVLKMGAPYDMAFNARIKLTEVFQGSTNTEGIKKELKKMLKDSKNKDFLDQIYYALGNMELADKNIPKAIEYYDLSVKNSTNNKKQKGLSQLALGNLYYEATEYRQAQPNYQGAVNNLGKTYPGMNELSKLAVVLGDMAGYYETIEREDSLQRIAKMDEGNRNLAIQKIILKKKRDEREAQNRESLSTIMGTDRMIPIDDIGVDRSTWYFYNPQLIETGRSDFKSLWGDRKLEDDWRRSQKTVMAFRNGINELDDQSIDPDNPENDPMMPEYYIKTLPLTPEKVAASNKMIEKAYFGLAEIFNNNLDEYTKALNWYEMLSKRFPENEFRLQTLFGEYNIFTKQNDKPKADSVKALIIEEFPNSRYAIILSDPHYLEKLEQRQQDQEELYLTAYENYQKGKYVEVRNNYKSFNEKFPDSKLVPYFEYLNTLASANVGNGEDFYNSLKEIVTKYGKLSFNQHASYILSQIEAGKKPIGGSWDLASFFLKAGMEMPQGITEVAANEIKEKPVFENDPQSRHYIILLFSEKKLSSDKLLYEVARFNFKKFLVKDYDLSFNKLRADTAIMIINGFTDRDDALWYKVNFQNDPSLVKILQENNMFVLAISDNNFRNLVMTRDLKGYDKFYRKEYLPLEEKVTPPTEKPLPPNMFMPR